MTAEAPEFVMWTPDAMRQRPAVHADDLVDGRRARAGDSDEVLRLSKPFAIELPIREITP
ncbi:hypothetical protein [Paractinoplanes toevensis]|uniref:Uncharacterized protein n=1 Tax=Paractinoplanes toevensis TaxID=571911 RepID=A0A919WDV2_9ACTN|nr:hypothetical protein [Actinoplanes toevensis]GIM98331.1 hypothetical protein Ato02nite_101240 [Actinoplanes toevensis]